MNACLPWLLCLVAVAGLGACASAPQTPPLPLPPDLLHDELFVQPGEPIRAEDVFALSEPMHRFLAHDLARSRQDGLPVGALFDDLYRSDKLKLVYDATRTRNAAEAFGDRAGNCLSLVIMTAAFAKELGMRVSYQSVDVEEVWSRSGDLLVGSGHVNVTLGPRLGHGGQGANSTSLTIDFLPSEEANRLRTREIQEHTVVAMYMNNRAAEALVRARLDDAYGWIRAALRQDPEFPTAYNTLGVIYRRHGDRALAADAFRVALARAPGNTGTMENLADAMEALGLGAEARALRAEIERIEPNRPFHFFELGMAAMERQDYVAARAQFAREVARADYNDEFHFWLAVADFRLGRLAEARAELGLAQARSTTRDRHDLYGAKLAWLRAHDADAAHPGRVIPAPP
jgi:Tfp pilus assembly protein PilF